MCAYSKFYLKSICVILCASVSIGCAPRMALEPVGDGEFRYGASLGGPLVAALGTTIPIPNASVGGRYGVGADLDIEGNAYLLPLAYSIVSMDVGLAWYPLQTPSATISLEPRVLLFASVKSRVTERFRIYPAISTTLSTPLGVGRGYAGMDVSAIVSTPTYDPEPVRVLLSPLAGVRWDVGDRVTLTTELKWVGVNVRTNATVEYVNPFGVGGLAPSIGIDFPW